MQKKTIGLLLAAMLSISLAACTIPSGTPTPLPTNTVEPTGLPAATATTAPPTPTAAALDVPPPKPGTVVLDFVSLVCSAQWSNNANYLPCPGDLSELQGGYVAYSDHTVAEGMVSVEAPLLIAHPSEGYPEGLGLFGRYPAFTIFPGDAFHATLACQGDSPCDVEYALEYFDADGTYHASQWKWRHRAADGPTEVSADLSALAGQTVELMLVIREKNTPQDSWVLWIQPYVARDPNAQPAPTAIVVSTPTASDKTPGVISGMVDMRSAPPYLIDDPYGAGGRPVVVVFFNLDDKTYWYIQTSLTGHPYYQMTVTPGRYQVVAYARGVGDVPYVTAGYTGQNPSCGQPLKTVNVDPNAAVENIVIADWNWSCSGTAYRPSKPAKVPVP